MALTSERVTGAVKWFNNKSGFGFITVCDEGEFKGVDIFVHYSSLRGETEKYRYLVQGEYVEFQLAPSNKEDYKIHAVDVSGIRGGPIMCDVRRMALRNEREHDKKAAPEGVSVGDQQGFQVVDKKTHRRH